MPFRTTVCLLLTLAALSVLLPSARGQPPQAGIPATGKLGPGLEPLDRAVVAMMARHGIPGAALAVARDGKLVLARGFGWADLAAREPVRPDTRFGVASLSKAFTAVAVLKLVEEGKLRLDDRAFEMLRHIKPFPGARVGPRLYRITVRQLLNHSGGWDTKASGDPVNWTTQVQLKRGDRVPVSAEHLIAFTMGVPLDFDPGTDSKYSNFGYIVLGEVIAKASGQPYEKYVPDGLCLYGLRHSFATAFLADNPNEIDYLRVLLGHKDYKMIFLHYGHLIDQHEKINKKLDKFDPFGTN